MCSADGRLLFKDCIDVIHFQKRNEKQHAKGSRMEIKYLKGKSDVLTLGIELLMTLAAVPNLSDLIKSKAVSKSA
jgi:hypothetical protein